MRLALMDEEFDGKRPRYDQSTLKGRIKHFYSVFDPLLLFTTDSKLKESISLLEKHKSSTAPPDPSLTPALWEAKRITDALLHPQTGRKVPLPFRFSAFVPMNIPLVIGMVTARSPAAQLFWQWANQSYNVAINFCNGNKTAPLPPAKVALAYASAVTVSCGVVLAMGAAVRPASRASRSLGVVVKATAPFLSVAVAGVSNAFLMRRNELQSGISVADETGEVMGVSRKAAEKAVAQVCATRAFLPVPIVLVPGLLMLGIDRLDLFKKAPRLYMPFNVALVSAIIYFSLPLSIGLFPQQGSIRAQDAEEKFWDIRNKDGRVVKVLYFNKGL